MKFEKVFTTLSYLAVLCGFISLWVSGTFGLFGSAVFILVLIAAWFLEGSRWQISERMGTVLIVAALPFFYGLWRVGFFHFADSGMMVAGVLSRLILSLSAIKILQRKTDRDWIFLYLMAFFEVLLAAGLSISATYLASFVLYVFVMVWTIIVFEIRKTDLATRKKLRPDGIHGGQDEPVRVKARRLPMTAAGLIAFIVLLAVPLFFLLPRVGGAGIGGSQGGISTSSGFSDTVRLGGIGSIQQNEEIVMRVRLEGNPANTADLKWRGIALDTFDDRSWSRSQANAKEAHVPGDLGLIKLDDASGRQRLTIQTVYLEPIDNPVLFGLARMIGVQGNFNVLFKDRHDAVSFGRVRERISYKVYSDRSLPSISDLRADRAPYDDVFVNYLQLPDDLDPRVRQLSSQVTGGSRNRYDRAKTIESYLQSNFGYTLEQKASGDHPLADFLFNVREGHCEYFATAMAVMLRTQGIATRVVNGFSGGEYNDTADVWVIRQKNAHSWVEVYFPGEKAWVPFDPTPFSGQPGEATPVGLTASFNKYLEALETFWIQYFVAFDNQEQRSLFTSVRRGMADYQMRTSTWLSGVNDRVAAWWREARGDKGIEGSASAIGRVLGYAVATGVLLMMFVWLRRRVVKSKVWNLIRGRIFRGRRRSIIAFYEKMIRLLEERGFVREPHQTPLEFAFAVGMPEAVTVTEKYNRVRFGGKDLSEDEQNEIETLIGGMANDRS